MPSNNAVIKTGTSGLTTQLFALTVPETAAVYPSILTRNITSCVHTVGTKQNRSSQKRPLFIRTVLSAEAFSVPSKDLQAVECRDVQGQMLNVNLQRIHHCVSETKPSNTTNYFYLKYLNKASR